MLTRNEEYELGVALAKEAAAAEVASRIIEELPLVQPAEAGVYSDDDITVEADNANNEQITLVADEVATISELIDDWNLANPENTVSLADGDPDFVPEEDVVIPAGQPAINNAAELANAIKDDEKTRAMIRERFIVAFGIEKNALEYVNKINAITDAFKAYAAEDSAAFEAAQDKLVPLSEDAKENFVVALGNRDVANSITQKIEKAATNIFNE